VVREASGHRRGAWVRLGEALVGPPVVKVYSGSMFSPFETHRGPRGHWRRMTFPNARGRGTLDTPRMPDDAQLLRHARVEPAANDDAHVVYLLELQEHHRPDGGTYWAIEREVGVRPDGSVAWKWPNQDNDADPMIWWVGQGELDKGPTDAVEFERHWSAPVVGPTRRGLASRVRSRLRPG
jgi:hypothetical protein